jgi:hypothetical protein
LDAALAVHGPTKIKQNSDRSMNEVPVALFSFMRALYRQKTSPEQAIAA